VMVSDQVNNEFGLRQGEMTDQQAAAEAVRVFWQALIDGDYQEAGTIYSGVSADKMKERFGRFKVIRVISMDEPSTDAVTAMTSGFRVKSVVEVEVDGKTVQQPFGPLVRKGDDPSRPNNWMIHGGI
jgi:hypothetical protein